MGQPEVRGHDHEANRLRLAPDGNVIVPLAQRPGEDEPRDQNPPEGTEGGAMAGRTEIQKGDPLRGLDASRRAAIYKLPPRVRDPLLEGMRQKGPAAYQDVIDTYFRQLGRDIPQ
jgi:hypothetical protein